MAAASSGLQQDAFAGCGDLWIHPDSAAGWRRLRPAPESARHSHWTARVRLVRADRDCAWTRNGIPACPRDMAATAWPCGWVLLHLRVYRGARGVVLPRMDAEPPGASARAHFRTARDCGAVRLVAL